MSNLEPLLKGEDVAEILGISSRTLANWRSLGRGPRFVKVGSNVRYRPNDVREYTEQHRFQNTGEADCAA